MEDPGSGDPISQQAAMRFAAVQRTRGELRALLQAIVPVLDAVVAARENAARNYRTMARRGGVHAAHYRRRAEQLDALAARAREFAISERDALVALDADGEPT
ncbi:MAG TPA: hypothetical protein VGJ13_11410 [Pseudonocardiaceae bacterium]|jgi:hypothetical protein